MIHGDQEGSFRTVVASIHVRGKGKETSVSGRMKSVQAGRAVFSKGLKGGQCGWRRRGRVTRTRQHGVEPSSPHTGHWTAL